MRKTIADDLKEFRVRKGPHASTDEDGPNGSFIIPITPTTRAIVAASTEEGWDRISARVVVTIRSKGRKRVKTRERRPNWIEACNIQTDLDRAEDDIATLKEALS